MVVVVVGEQHVGERELAAGRRYSSSGSTGPPASIITACPRDSSSATTYVFDSHGSLIERSTIMFQSVSR